MAAIRATPEVYARWRGGEDLVAAGREDLAEPGAERLTIEFGGAVIGFIQWSAETDPDYRHAGIDIWTTLTYRPLTRTGHSHVPATLTYRPLSRTGHPHVPATLTYRPRAAATRPRGR
ncbi:hypothetical protein [Streptomyces sp. Inha503]|uniref:hypothetical protein n=1 Tax=Streptomyces sp. Inha503 TaxID=3383314 RepID=UPI00399F6DE2